MIFCHKRIIIYPSIPLCIYNCRLISFQYYVTNFTILSKTKCLSIYHRLRHDHESSGFQKLAIKWIDFLKQLWQYSRLLYFTSRAKIHYKFSVWLVCLSENQFITLWPKERFVFTLFLISEEKLCKFSWKFVMYRSGDHEIFPRTGTTTLLKISVSKHKIYLHPFILWK